MNAPEQSTALTVVERTEITADEIRAWLRYEPDTGIFTWRKKPNRRIKIGAVAGTLKDNGRIVIQVLGAEYFAHRLAWIYMTGVWPTNQIDHRSTIPSDNRWDNLRDVTHTVNMQNIRKPKKGSKSGVLGTCLNRGKYVSQIVVDQTHVWLGRFSTQEAAHDAYIEAKRKWHEGNTL